MIMTIGGLAGSGTTTTAKALSKRMNIPFVSAGTVFREMAVEYGMTIFEFGKFAEDNVDIDVEIDKRQADLAKKSENLILEGRLSAYFVEADLKIWLIAPLEVRANRVCNRESKSMKQAKEEIALREESETLRYSNIHNIDINDFGIYDLVLNSDRFSPEDITDIILTTLKVI